MHDIIFAFQASHGPKGSIFEGSGARDMRLRRASTNKARATSVQNDGSIRIEKRQVNVPGE